MTTVYRSLLLGICGALLSSVFSVSAAPGAGQIRLGLKDAKATKDIGRNGKAQGGGMPDAGDEYTWALGNIEENVYRIRLEVRTGDADPGTNYVESYRMRAPDSAFAEGAEPHDTRFSFDSSAQLETLLTKPTYKVIRGRIVADDLLFLKPGDSIRIWSTGNWRSVWRLVLDPVAPDAATTLILKTSRLGNRFALSEKVELGAEVTHWGPKDALLHLACVVKNKKGEEAFRADREIAVRARSVVLEKLPLPLKQAGVFLANARLLNGKKELAEATLHFALVPVPHKRYPFVIPGDDAIRTVTDMSHLSPGPAGADGFVRIKDGKFFTDEGRLRIWGVNTTFAANFPRHKDAEKVAAHLAKLGFNGVRMHHHDNGAKPRGVWGKFVNGKRQFDPEMLDRQDYFLDQLHKHGIYVNLNLHVSRTFTGREGFPGKDLPRAVRYDKYLLYYMPGMRELFKEFCRMYLTHKNPYRKLRRVDDPGIAMIEITNENAFSTRGPTTATQLPEPYRGEFKRQWNEWLAARYKTSAALRRVWKAAGEPLGDDVSDMGDLGRKLEPWRLNQQATYPVKALFGQPGPAPDLPCLKLDIVRSPGQSWRQELQLNNLSVEKGRLYTLSFWARSEQKRKVFLDVSNQGPDNWRSLGFATHLEFPAKWHFFERIFRAKETIRENARICFKFGDSNVDFYLARVRLRRGGEFKVLPKGQSLEQRNVEIPVVGWVDDARSDVRRFMADTEKGFIREIVRYLKNDLGVKVPVTASQITYHGAEIVAETCDYADIHAYWEHPHFPGKPWDSRNWFIPNTPMERAPGSDSLTTRGPWRLLDRPFTLSEWNIPAPNDYAGTVVPAVAAIAALQDWDGIFFFDYGGGNDRWFTDRLSGYFTFNSHPVKLALITACANLYRRGDLKPLARLLEGTLDEHLSPSLAVSYRIGINPEIQKPDAFEEIKAKRLSSPDGSVVWDAEDPARAYMVVNSPATRGVWGLVADQQFELGGLKLSVGKAERNYAAIVVTSLDGQPLEKSKRMLLVAAGSAENMDMVWNLERTSVSNKWGRGPTRINLIRAQISLNCPVKAVYTLDGRGNRLSQLEVAQENGSASFSIGYPRSPTLWYEIVAD